MKKNIEQLYSVSLAQNRLIIGLMSGTSLDGLDVALCRVSGSGLNTRVEIVHFETVAYTAGFKDEIRSVFSKKTIDLEKLTLLNPWIALAHAAVINSLLKKWDIKKEEVAFIASHGQTIYHAPASLHQQQPFGNATLQLGDGDHLAVATGITVISDFRQKHIAAGGEGAPLAVYGDYLIFGKEGEDRVLLNIGGIANFTFLPGNRGSSAVFSTDTGPGNTMMDALMRQQFDGKHYDADATVAKTGIINEALLQTLKEDDFFGKPFPKTTGPELFNLRYLQAAKEKSGTQHLGVADTMATLNKFSADTIARAVIKATGNKGSHKLFVSGGGVHNPLLMQHLKEQLPDFLFDTTAAFNINPDAKEAVLFAVLANECVCGNGSYLQPGVNGMPVVSMGKISFPD